MRFTLDLGEWLPDAPDLKNPGLSNAKGVYPSAGGYAPWWSGETTGLSVTGTVMGAQRFERSNGNEVLCVGTDSDLYVITGGTVFASSLAMTSINAADEAWLFEQFGAVDRVSLITDRDTGQPRGFAFVEMDEGASEAIAALDQKDFGGRNLRVNEARPREPRQKRW